MLAVRGDGPVAQSVSNPSSAGCQTRLHFPFVCHPAQHPPRALSTMPCHLRCTPTPGPLCPMNNPMAFHRVAVKAPCSRAQPTPPAQPVACPSLHSLHWPPYSPQMAQAPHSPFLCLCLSKPTASTDPQTASATQKFKVGTDLG